MSKNCFGEFFLQNHGMGSNKFGTSDCTSAILEGVELRALNDSMQKERFTLFWGGNCTMVHLFVYHTKTLWHDSFILFPFNRFGEFFLLGKPMA